MHEAKYPNSFFETIFLVKRMIISIPITTAPVCVHSGQLDTTVSKGKTTISIKVFIVEDEEGINEA